MAVDEAVLDYDPIGEFEQDDRKMLRMLLVAAQRQMVDTVAVSAATGAKLEPVGLDLVPFAMVRSVGTTGVGMDLEDEGDEAVIDIGAHVTNIVVHARGTVRFVRILPSGGRDMTLAIARGIGVEDDVAERLKRGEEVELETPPRVDREDGEEVADAHQGQGDRDAAGGELRRRDPLVARVLHGAGAGRSHRARAGHGRRLEAGGAPRAPAPAYPGRGRGGPGVPARTLAALAVG